MKRAYFYQTSIGRIGIAENGEAVTNIFFGETVKPSSYFEEETELIKKASKQISEYLSGKRKTFDIPLEPEGSEFEKGVWKELGKIPYGETMTYGEIAAQIGNSKASRAVGRANGKNPISILIPCHRVIGTNGKLTGYAGGLQMKSQLLMLEGIRLKE